VLSLVLKDLPGLRFSVSHTTRPPRPGEREGVQYHFVDEAAFEGMREKGLLLEWASVHGHLYGTALAEYERAEREGVDLLLDLDVQGAAKVRAALPDAVTVFILPPSYEDLERRLRGRGQDDAAAIRRRLEVAKEELSRYGEYNYAIVNDDLRACAEALKAVIEAARFRLSRMEAAARAVLATFHLEKGGMNR
jgi:guanylate kinase